MFAVLAIMSSGFSPPEARAQNTALQSPSWHVCFTPGDQCADHLIAVLDAAKLSIRVQAYSFTAKEIADALIRARIRGVDVVVILDKSQTRERFSMIDEMKDGGILVYIDECCAIAHNKVMIIDERTVVTGSYNFTKSAEVRNAENMLIIDDPALAARYLANWQNHRQGSDAYAKR
jgi:phosphatidylserine/phosphatidylglycerophosphate/cardiolipin synthase-like enzyme